jgi:hypothetical protein
MLRKPPQKPVEHLAEAGRPAFRPAGITGNGPESASRNGRI